VSAATDPRGPGVSAPDTGEARTYRQYLPAGRRPIQVLRALSFAWLVVGFLAFWQLIETTDARGGPALLVSVAWIGPIIVLSIPQNVGARGPIRGWWWPRQVIRVDDDGVAWWAEGSVRRPEDAVAWSAVATIGPTLPSPSRPPGADCALTGADGRVLARLPCRLVRIDRPASRPWRRVAWLPDVAVAVRPDRYRRRRVLGRRATLRDPEADATA
jgi:hypothetical protein